MEHAFDAYHKWLGIPPECQPPDHYRLLGLQSFESDPDVIQAAADQRMMHLRAYQTGKNSEWSQRLLNEVAAAKVCLLNAAKKAAYDQKLREALGRRSSRAQPPPAIEPPNPSLNFAPDESRPRVQVSPYVLRNRRLPLAPVIAGLAAVAALLIVSLVLWALQHAESPAVTNPQADAPPSQAGTHGMALNTPKKGDGPVEPTRKVGKTPTPDPVAPKKPSPEKGSHAGVSDPPNSVMPGQGTDVIKSPDNNLPTPFELPKKDTKEGNTADESNRNDPGTPPVKPTPEEQPSVDQRAAEPSAEAQEEALKVARDLFKDDLTKARTPEEKQTLAKKMLDQAENAANADVGTFALLRLARDTAAQALNGATAFAAVDLMAERYQIDVVKMKTELLSAFAKKARLPSQHLLLAEQAARLMIEAQGNEDFDRAVNLARLASSEGGQAHDKELVTLAKTGLRECQQAAALVAQFNAAQATLAKTPDDPAANLAVGIYYCGLKNDWDKGLPCLVKGDDPDLKGLAERELKSPPNSADDQVTLAEVWWTASQTAEGTKKGAMVRRSAYWCKKAQSDQVGGLSKVKVEKRLDEIAKLERDSPAAILAARPVLPINKWLPLFASPNAPIGWETADCHFSYSKGIVELREGEMFCPIVTKDVTIRAKVKCSTTSQVRLFIRSNSQGCYAAVISNGTLSIVKRKVSAGNGGRSGNADADVLNKVSLPRNKRGVRVLEFEFAFAAAGDVLTASVNNGRVLLQAKDAAFSEGSVGIGTGYSSSVFLADVSLLIPNKASLVADQRSPVASKPSPPKSP